MRLIPSKSSLKPTGAVVASALVTVGLIACGGGDGRLSKDDFTKKANASCKVANDKADTLDKPGQGDFSGLETYADRLSTVLTKHVRELEALKPPKDVENDFNDYIDKQKNGRDLIDNLKDDARNQDAAAVSATGQKLSSLGDSSDSLAKKLDLSKCAGA